MAQALPRLPTQELCSTAVLRRQAAQCIPGADTAVLASMDLSVPEEWSEVPEVPGFTMLTFCIILHARLARARLETLSEDTEICRDFAYWNP